ncbi:MAG TPA: excinuclease ABC subunit UvrC [candidate division Zixibacteria bacterium]|nr:excinuclease ABC subunit UvrC [candidate division Zixibacteria bacterium]
MKTLPDALKVKLKNLPTGPGVYMFRDESGKIIYIGKAKVLRNRVRSYFQGSRGHDAKTARLVSRVADVELMVTATEVEALILEANLVREHKPRYNVALKDDKHFPYIKITTDEPFPRVLIVRRLERDNATYFGPYTSAKSMRSTVALLTRLFTIRTCNLTIPHPSGKPQPVCLDYYIKRCSGPCAGHQNSEEYKELVDAVVMVLSGRSSKLIDRLTKKMQVASDAMEYEQAAVLRDQIEAIRKIMIKQNVDIGEIVDRDIVSIAREKRDAVAVVMQIREGVLIGRQDFQLTADEDDPNETVLDTFLKQYYNHQPNLPDELCLPLDIPETDLLAAWLRQLKGSPVRIKSPKARGHVRLVELAAANARLLLDELLIQKRGQAERTSKMVSSLQEQLGLYTAPRRISCFDISNTGETDAVGSCVFFENGKPKKSGYRHFKIKTIKGQDDFAMMREVIGRYFSRIRDEEIDPPDLVVVDGGKGQLSSALAELQAQGFSDQAVIGLAKRLEEVFRPGESDPVTLDRRSPALMLLKQVRDEAHRFAITYNRKVRSKRTIKSALDDIPGIGPAKRKLLLDKFGSVAQIKQASLEELTALQGINEKLARLIMDAIKPD